MFCADGENVLKLGNGAACCDDAHIGLELGYASVGIGGIFDHHADMGEAVADYLRHILADVAFVAAECAHQLAAMLDNIAHEIAAHLARTVLNNSDFAIHKTASLMKCSFKM